MGFKETFGELASAFLGGVEKEYLLIQKYKEYDDETLWDMYSEVIAADRLNDDFNLDNYAKLKAIKSILETRDLL